MKKTLSYGAKSFYIAWKANGFYTIISIFNTLYERTLYPLIQVFLISKVLDLFTKFEVITFSDLRWIIFYYLVASLLKLGIKSLVDVKESFMQVQLEGHIDLQISKKLTELDPATFENPEFQNLIAQMEGVKGTLQAHLGRFISLVDAVFKFVTATIVVSATFPVFTPIILIATIPSYFVWNRLRVVTWPFYVEKKSLVGRVTHYIKSLLSSDSTSKEAAIFKTGDTLLHKIARHQMLYYNEFDKTNKPWVIRILLAKIFQFGAFIYTQYLNLLKVLGGTLSIGNFALVFQQTLNLTSSAEDILNLYSSMSARNKYLDKFFEFLATEKIIKSPSNAKKIPQKPTPALIEFKDVSFKYPTTQRFILKNFNLTIQSGEKIALVGENGAGKTTIIKLLLRFHDVSEGAVLINGVNIKDLSLDEWHKKVGALFQDFIKYQFTFKENVYFGDLTKPKRVKFLKDAILKSGADKYVKNLPEGKNQVLGKMFEGGIDLSGGQWQKLALARVFYRNAPFLILDEPTSAIDAKAEYEIFEKIQNLQKDKTVIIISHRFSTVRNADRILVLDGGKIIEEGNHKELMLKKGLYEELFNLQAQGYK